MRRAITIVLVAVLSSGCYTTTTRDGLTTSPLAEGGGERQVTGLVLADGTEVLFVEPAVLGTDGTVYGRVRVAYAGPLDAGSATSSVSYAPEEISRYRVTSETREFSTGKTIGLVLGVPAAVLGTVVLLYYISCDPDSMFC